MRIEPGKYIETKPKTQEENKDNVNSKREFVRKGKGVKRQREKGRDGE